MIYKGLNKVRLLPLPTLTLPIATPTCDQLHQSTINLLSIRKTTGMFSQNYYLREL